MHNSFLHKEDGQVLVWMAVAAVMLILFTGIAVDMGIIYLTKARLSNATDSAVLTAANNFNQGQTAAQNLGNNMFWANFGSTSPSLTWTWCPGPAVGCGDVVAAGLYSSTTVDTAFLGYLPALRTWHIGDQAQATRSTLIMTLVLDRSGSMDTNGGESALKVAVPNFIADFIPGTDFMSMVTFASDARVDIAMTQQWGPPSNLIDHAVAALNPGGGTFGTGAGTNTFDAAHGPPLSLADYQNNSVSLPATQPQTKVVVYFTDGLMNTIQDKLPCTSTPPGPNRLYNFGGFDAAGTPDFFDPTSSDFTTNDYSAQYSGGNNFAGCSGGTDNGLCQSNPPYSLTARCQGVTTWVRQSDGRAQAFSGNQAGITLEAEWRALYTGKQMRQETPFSTYIFVIGLGSGVNNACTEAFLSSLANDPNGPTNYNCPAHPAVYDPTLPDGLFEPVINCPSTACTADLNQAFQKIASKVLLRLTR